LEKWFDVLKESNLLFDGVSTSLRNIKQEKNTGVQMCKSCDSLHFNSVSLIKWMVKDTRSIDNLPFSIFVIGVTDEQTLGGESVWLNIDIGVRHIVN